MSLLECVLPAVGAPTIGGTAIGLGMLFGYHLASLFSMLSNYKTTDEDERSLDALYMVLGSDFAEKLAKQVNFDCEKYDCPVLGVLAGVAALLALVLVPSIPCFINVWLRSALVEPGGLGGPPLNPELAATPPQTHWTLPGEGPRPPTSAVTPPPWTLPGEGPRPRTSAVTPPPWTLPGEGPRPRTSAVTLPPWTLPGGGPRPPTSAVPSPPPSFLLPGPCRGRRPTHPPLSTSHPPNS